MGKPIITEEMFPEIIEQYNSGGKTAAYSLIRSKYGVKNPYFVIARIKACSKYTYDQDSDNFKVLESSPADEVFLGLDELCAPRAQLQRNLPESPATVTDSRPAAMEKLIHELISDRLLTISRYIEVDSSTRTIFVDQTSLTKDGYQMVFH